MASLAALTVLALAGDPTPPPPSLRLPGNVRPVRQAIDLTLDPDARSRSRARSRSTSS